MSTEVGVLAWLLLAMSLSGCGRPDDAPRTRQVPGGVAERGPAAFTRYGCGGCHVIPGVAQASGRVAPPLTDFADRAYVAGVLPNAPDSLVAWLMDPQGVHPGTAMPDLGVTEQDARDMSAYLYTLSRPRR